MLHRSIGIEPPRLHCGRAANYGSIIVPNTCRRLRREQPGFYRVSCIARSFLRSWRTHESGSGVLAHSVGNVHDAGMFGFQGSLSGKTLRKQICRISCGENPLTIRWVCSRIFGHFYFPSHLSMDIFPPVVRYRTEYIFACGWQRGGRAEALFTHLSMDIFSRNLNHRENIFLLRRRKEQRRRKPYKQGLGKAIPNKIPMGQNERTANYGTSVESCSDNSRSATAVKPLISPSTTYKAGQARFAKDCG